MKQKISIVFLLLLLTGCAAAKKDISTNEFIKFENKKVNIDESKQADDEYIINLFINEKFDEFESEINKLNTDLTKNANRVEKLFYKIADKEDILPKFEEWFKLKQDSYLAFNLRGVFYIKYAWKARGGDWAKNVPQDAWPIFFKRLETAKKDLEKSYQLNPDVPYASAELIVVGRALKTINNKDEYMEKNFSNALKADPYNYNAHLNKLTSLMPKWSRKSFEHMFDFVRETLKKVPHNKELRNILLGAQMEMADRSEYEADFLQKPGFWDEIEKVYSDWIIEENDNVELKYYYAEAAMLAKKYDIALDELKKIENDYKPVLFPFEQHLVLFTDKGYKIYAYSLYGKGKYNEAIDFINKSIKISKKNVFLYNMLSLIYYDLKDFEKSYEFAKKVNLIDSEEKVFISKKMFENAKSLYESKKHKESIEILNKIIEIKDDYEDAYMQSAYSYLCLGDRNKAIESANKYRKLNNNKNKNFIIWIHEYLKIE